MVLIKSLQLKLAFLCVIIFLIALSVFLLIKDPLVSLPIALAVVFTSVLFLTRFITEPVNRIIRLLNRFSGQTDSSFKVNNSGDEISFLSAAFNYLIEDIDSKVNEIRLQNQKFNAIFNAMVEGVAVIDSSGRIISYNHAFKKLFEVRGDDIKGRHFLEVARSNEAFDTVNRVLESGRGESSEIEILFPDKRSLQLNAAAILDGDVVSGCLIVTHDITEIRRLEEMRRSFVANVSHELKTPLTSIKGFVETLLDGAIDDKNNARDFLNIILGQTERLNNIVSDLLTLSRMESGKEAVDKTPLNIRDYFDKILKGFGYHINKRLIKIENNLPGNLIINADPKSIVHLCNNLIDNAIKFNKEGGLIRISAEDSAEAVKISVEDTGAGIPRSELSRIFERFYRVDKARSRDDGGTGLGLSIAKHIAELHGGRIGVESAEGTGSKFYFILPKDKK